MEKAEKTTDAEKPCCTVKVVLGEGMSEDCCGGRGGEQVIKLDCCQEGTGPRTIKIVCVPGSDQADGD